MDGLNSHPAFPIAIVGMALRFPGGARDPSSLWQMLLDGVDAIGDIPSSRWDHRKFWTPEGSEAGKTYASQGGFLEHPIHEFDAAFFGMAPREAALLDPQQRLLLEATWEAMEDAGIPHEHLRHRAVGVFVGGFCLDNKIERLGALSRDAITSQTATSATMVMLSNRISHTFDFVGPSFTMDTACSSSLVATHQACQSLRNGESELAFAAGVNVMLRPEYFIAMSKGGFLSRRGRCQAFDANADGYVRGEGVGVVLLKPLARALEDRDPIYATILATGVNQDGKTPGIAMPSGDSQKALMEQVVRRAGLAGTDLSYVEAHGPGTQAGDPIEAASLGEVFGTGRREDAPLWVGSIKTNVGHMEAVAGVAGLCKAALVLKHRTIPPNLHFTTPNPKIDFASLRLKVPTSAVALPPEGTLYTAVNSFGYGGTNAHAILASAPEPQEAPLPQPPTDDAPTSTPRPFPLCAATPEALQALAENMRPVVAGSTLDVLGGTLSHRRTHLPYRTVLWARDTDDLLHALADLKHTTQGWAPETARKTLFVYTGMGAQYAGMGEGLYTQFAVFREAIQEIDAFFVPLAGWSLDDFFSGKLVLFAQGEAIEHPEYAQPTNFALQVALTKLWRAMGVEAQGVVGHSVGELAAIWAAGALSLEDAVTVMAHRATLQQELAGQGAMLAVGLGEQDAQTLLEAVEATLEIGAINGPDSVTLTGSHEEVETFHAMLQSEEIFSRRLRIAVAYHSRQMEPIRERFLASIEGIKPRAPKIPFFSSVTGGRLEGAAHDPTYFWRNAREPVAFQAAIEAALTEGFDGFLEVGPHRVLSMAITSCATQQEREIWTDASLRRAEEEVTQLRRAWSALFIAGGQLNWEAWFAKGAHTDLPRYPWQRSLMWSETQAAKQDRGEEPLAPLLHQRRNDPQPCWESTLSEGFLPYLSHHVIAQAPLFPAAGYIAAALSVARACEAPLALQEVTFAHPLVVEQPKTMRIVLDEQTRKLGFFSQEPLEEHWHFHASTRLSIPPLPAAPAQPQEWTQRWASLPHQVDPSVFYPALEAQGLAYGPMFQAITELRTNAREFLAKLSLPAGLTEEFVHPVLLDAAFHALFALQHEADARLSVMVPASIKEIRCRGPVGREVLAQGHLTFRNSQALQADLRLLDPQTGAILVEVDGLRCQRLPQAERTSSVLFTERWEPQEISAPRSLPPSVLLLSFDQALGDGLAASLAQEGCHCRFSSPTFLEEDGQLAQMLSEQQEGAHIVWLGASKPLDATGQREMSLLLQLLQGLAQRPDTAAFSLTLVTRDAHGPESRPEQAALWGLARVALNEHPALTLRLVDIPTDKVPLAALKTELLHPSAERECRLAQERWCARLAPWEPPARHAAPTSTDQPLALCQTQAGDLDSLAWVEELPRREPGEGEVAIRTLASPLNFKDVMKVMGMLPAAYLEETFFGDTLGMETAGVITAVGPGVTAFQQGDEVVVPNPEGSFATHTIASTRYMVPRPAPLSICESPVFINFITAYYGLCELGRLGQDEWVLIHSAAGGVGQAAISVARMRNARIIATAGSEEKREVLRQQGIQWVFDSRSLDFVAGVQEATSGQGVDVVLNSLSGEALHASWQLLAPYGRFIEIGKRDIQADVPLGLSRFDRNRTFAALDIDRMMVERPLLFRRLLDQVWALLNDQTLAPLPIQVFPADQVAEAFRTMARARHVGKVVVSLEPHEVQAYPPSRQALFSPDRTYLITGGTQGFGLALAHWLVSQGARHLALLSRRGLDTPGTQEAVAALQEQGATVQVGAVDVTDEEQLRAFLERFATSKAPLDGIFHAAMVLDDGILTQLTPERLARVMAPKAYGAYLLDKLSESLELDLRFFVLFSSISGLLGNPGQASYAAANVFLDALARQRQARNQPALAVDWGVIADAGVMTREETLAKHFQKMGIQGIPSADAFKYLEQLLRAGDAQVCVAQLDWKGWARTSETGRTPRLELLVQAFEEGEENQRDVMRTRILTQDGDPKAFVLNLLCEELARVLQMEAEDLLHDRSLNSMGVDSLMAVELSTRVEHEMGVTLPTHLLMKGPTLEELAKHLLTELMGLEELDEASVEQLSPEETDAMLQLLLEAGEIDLDALQE